MADCGIERYDKLPSRIGTVDVDALRFALSKANKDFKNALQRKVEIQAKLEVAYVRSKEI